MNYLRNELIQASNHNRRTHRVQRDQVKMKYWIGYDDLSIFQDRNGVVYRDNASLHYRAGPLSQVQSTM